MPYCTHCRKEYIDNDSELCPECGRFLLPERPTWRPYDPDEPLIAIAVASNEFEAYLKQGQLEQEGIPVVVQSMEAGAPLGLTVNGWGEHRIFVPESLAEEAREVLAAYEE